VTYVTPIAIADEARLTEVRVELESLAASLAAEWATDVTALGTIQGTGGEELEKAPAAYGDAPLNATRAGRGGPRPRRTGRGWSGAEVDDTSGGEGKLQQPVQQRALNGGGSDRTPADATGL
jgi:hypothetical protein